MFCIPTDSQPLKIRPFYLAKKIPEYLKKILLYVDDDTFLKISDPNDIELDHSNCYEFKQD